MRTLVGLLVIAFMPALTVAQPLAEPSPEQIAEAIRYAQTARDPRGFYAAGRFGYTTPYSRVVIAAYLAKTTYQPFSPADVTPEMLMQEIDVYVSPDVNNARRAGPTVASPEHVVIMPKGSADLAQAIQPLATSTVDQRYQNLLGASWTANAIRARFPLSALHDGYEIRVRYSDGQERRGAFKLKGVK